MILPPCLALLALGAVRAQEPAPPAAVPEPSASDVPWRRQPVEPRYETDFTAWTVPRRHVRLGPVYVQYGLLDNLHAGTSLPLDVLGIPNLHGKVTAIHTPRFDASFQAEGLWWRASADDGSDEITLTAWPLTATASWIPWDRLGVHAGVRWDTVDVAGTFGLDTLSDGLEEALQVDLGEEIMAWAEESGAVYGGARVTVTQARAALDWQINRRDSLILQFHKYTLLHARVDAGAENEAGDRATGVAFRAREPLGSYVGATTTLSWQFTWPRFRVRLGFPIPSDETSLPLAWIPQAFELYWLL